MEVKTLVEDIAKSLVNSPDQVEVREISSEAGLTTLGLKVAPEDLGRVIGKQGRTARSIRSLLNAAGSKSDRRFFLEIQE